MRGAATLLPLPFACAVGAFVAHLWFAHAPHAIAADIAQPLVVVTAWGGYGAAGFAILAGTLAVATLALIFAARAPRAGVVGIVTAAVAALAADLAWPATFSSDVYAYAAYGDLAARGFDPYVLAPAWLHDGFLDGARFQWSGPFPVCVYGPAFVAYAHAIVSLTGRSGVGTTLALMRAASCAAFLGSIALLGLALRAETRERRSLALYAYGLNPVALWSAAEGHNDTLLLLAATAAFALARRRDVLLGGFALALGPIVKAPGTLFALVFALRATWIERAGPARIWLGVGAGTAVAAALAIPPLLPALARLSHHGVYAPAVSVQGLVGPMWATLIAAALLGNGVRLLVAHEELGFAWAGLALVVALPNVYPWYSLWLVPLALAAGPGGASSALWGATIFAAVRYLPDATGNMTVEAARAASVVAALPFALAFAHLRPFARRKTTTPS